MKASLLVRRSLTWSIALVAVLIGLTAGLAAIVDAGYGHGLLVRFFALRFGRPIQVDGKFEAHLFSFNPRVVAGSVTIGNPPWVPAGLTAKIGQLSLVLKLPGFTHPGGIVELDMRSATLFLVRDAQGRANWQLTDPARRRIRRNSSIVRRVSMPDAHVELADARRHLQFSGTVSAANPGESGSVQPLRIQGNGQLNGRAAAFEIAGDPLADASHRRPYHFTFTERSGGSRIDGRGVLPQPFAYDVVDATFEATGPDLKDLYFLTGVRLIDTGDYRLTGSITRRGKHTVFGNLVAASGQSDMRGTVAVDSSSGRPKLDVDLDSRLLRLSDLGLRAAGRTSAPKSPLLLPDTMISMNVLRNGDAAVRFRASELDLGRLPLHDLSARATIDHGVLNVSPLLAEVLGGRVVAHVTLDGNKDNPAAKVGLEITNLQLEQIPHKSTDQSPIEGPAQVQVNITGAGRSVHQVAASANGTVVIRIPHGAVRDSFAELTGLDLRGLRLLLTKNKREVPVRCAIAAFKADDGTLVARTLVADTDPLLITGEGRIHMDSETVDLSIRGHPKSVRLFRLRTPVLVQGTLAHPSIGIQAGKPGIKIIDPGKAKDADCSALLAGPPV